MARPQPQHQEAVNADSFLDIVASVVSIMLIMVLMVGMRIKGKAVEVPMTDEAVAAKAGLMEQQAAEASLHAEVLGAADEAQRIEAEAALRGAERDMLAEAVTVLDYNVRTRREKLDAASRGTFDLARGVAQAKQRLEEVTLQRSSLETAAGPSVVIRNRPTPLSKTVDGAEAHFQLRDGRIAYIPMETLLRELKADAERQIHKLRDLPEMTDTVGPAGGFRMRYTFERKQVDGGGFYASLTEWLLVPTGGDLGETAQEALAPDSGFHVALAKYQPGRTTITLWIYPESFDAFRTIREELYRLGYQIAARPLPEGQPIAGSPEGSKSAAQ